MLAQFRAQIDAMAKKIFITGASGYIGARLCEDLEKKYDVIRSSRSLIRSDAVALDITNNAETMAVIKKHKPDIVVHSAALASSSECNKDPGSAEKINVEGTKNIAEAAKSVGAKLFLVSAASIVLKETEYERTKALSEEAVKSISSDYLILQPVVVFGLSPNTKTKKHFNQILANINGAGPYAYDNKWRFRPTWINDISKVIDSCIEMNINRNTIPIAVSDKTLKTTYEIARDILSNFNITPDQASTSSRPILDVDTSILHSLNLQTSTYKEMIKGITNEIKESGMVAQ